MTQECDGTKDRTPKTRLEVFLLTTRSPIWKYILQMSLLSLAGSLLLVALLQAIGPLNYESAMQIKNSLGANLNLFIIVLFAPFIETLLMSPILWALSFLTKQNLIRAFLSALVWAVLHAQVAAVWGAVIVWPFFIFSCSFIAWRQKSWFHAVALTFSIHALQNSIPSLFLI